MYPMDGGKISHLQLYSGNGIGSAAVLDQCNITVGINQSPDVRQSCFLSRRHLTLLTLILGYIENKNIFSSAKRQCSVSFFVFRCVI